jgi:hypothetical protein
MLEFYSSRYLRVCRFWRPSQIQRLLGKPDAMIAEDWVRSRRRPRPEYTQEQLEHLLVGHTVQRRVYLKSRVEAVEHSRAFRFDERRYAQSMRNWNPLHREASKVIAAVNALYWCREDPAFADADRLSNAEIIEKFEGMRPTNKGLESLYWFDDTLYCRCNKCGKLMINGSHAAADCLSWRKPQRIEITKSGYALVAPDGSHLAHFFNAAWALPLVMAIARKPQIDSPPKVIHRKGRRRRESDQLVLPLL